MFSEFEAKGSVSPKIFNDYENIVEDIIFDLEQFVKIEKEEVNAAHKHATQLIGKLPEVGLWVGNSFCFGSSHTGLFGLQRN